MIFFNNPFPRSGGALLQNILAQNDTIHAGNPDGILDVMNSAKIGFTNSIEFNKLEFEDRESAWAGFCKGALEGFCDSISGKPHTSINTIHAASNYKWLTSILGEPPKIIMMVRNLKAVLASREKIFRENPEYAYPEEDLSKLLGITTDSRVRIWLRQPPIGLALQQLFQLRLEKLEPKCLVLRYEDLTRDPELTMARVYKYLGLEQFDHDFDNIEPNVMSNEEFYGYQKKPKPIHSKIVQKDEYYTDILGKDLCKWIDETCSSFQRSYGYMSN